MINGTHAGSRSTGPAADAPHPARGPGPAGRAPSPAPHPRTPPCLAHPGRPRHHPDPPWSRALPPPPATSRRRSPGCGKTASNFTSSGPPNPCNSSHSQQSHLEPKPRALFPDASLAVGSGVRLAGTPCLVSRRVPGSGSGVRLAGRAFGNAAAPHPAPGARGLRAASGRAGAHRRGGATLRSRSGWGVE